MKGKRIARAGMAAAVAAAVVAAIAVLFLCLRVETRLLVSDGEGRRLATLVLPDGRFDHVFIHSFHLTPVEERFRIERAGLFRARLRLFELRYESLGVGMPEDAEGGFRLEDGKFVLQMDRSFDRIPILVSIVPGHGIVTAAGFRPFAEWTRLAGRITLEGSFALAWRRPLANQQGR
jgi:hypothetical protein